MGNSTGCGCLISASLGHNGAFGYRMSDFLLPLSPLENFPLSSQGICNYFYERVTSGMMEGINNKIKLLKRQAYGFTNFDHLRMRLLAAFFD